MKNKLKIFFFKKICHVTLNENKFKIINDLFVDNDSNNSNNNDFVLTILFTHFTFLIIVSDTTIY